MRKIAVILIAFSFSCASNTQEKKPVKFAAALDVVSTITISVVCHDTVDLPNDSLQLIGNACSDDFPILKTGWTQLSGPGSLTIGKGDSPYIKNFIAGTFILQYSATNTQGATSYRYDTLLVNPALVIPTVPKTVVTTVFDQNGKIIKADTITL